ncbi:31893_t:CDS:1, partial [Gigaspora margarita]
NGKYGVYFAYNLGMFVNYNGQDNSCFTSFQYGFRERRIDMGPPKTLQYYFVNEYEVFQIHK